MKRDEFRNVDIGDTVAVSQAKCLVIPHVRQRPPDTSAGFRLGAGLDQRYPPRLRSSGMKIDLIILEIDRDVRGMQEILRKYSLIKYPL